MNEYDSSRLADLLATVHGLTQVASPEAADVLLLNTCSIREKAADKVYSELGRWREQKLERPGTLIGVGGCVASQEGAALRERAPFVDIVFGPQTLHRVGAMLESVLATQAATVDVQFPEIEKFDALPEPGVRGPRAFVSIMEGCNKYCSFCVVPYTRGPEFSRPFDDVIAEIMHLVAGGTREIVLLGQNVNAYRGARHDGRVIDFAGLLTYLNEIDDLHAIRYTTSHPLEFSDRLIAAHRDLPKLAPHVHLPVQSGADSVLARMKRGYTRASYLSILDRLRAACPGIAVSTDFIVGYPGETDDEFSASERLVSEAHFDQSYVFPYSPRPGTPAATFADDVPQDVKVERLERLQTRLAAHAHDISTAMLGTVEAILVEREATRGTGDYCGRTGNHRVINFPGTFDLIGRVVSVRITDVQRNTLRGALVDPQATAHAPRAGSASIG